MQYTISQFRTNFPNDNACLEYIFKQRFGTNYLCPKCGKKGFYRVKKRKCYACAWCSYQIYPASGTIFHKSDTKLTDWFFVIYLMLNSKNNISSKDIQRYLGVTYKTAWRIGNKIRTLIKQGDNKLNLNGTIGTIG